MIIAFMGTPEFALPSLDMLVKRGDHIEVFTQPDRAKDRGHGVAMPPVKQYALQNGLKVHQFERIRSEAGVAALRALAPDIMVTAAFGQILSEENLGIPKYGCINVHASLLPKYRGAAPIQWAVINGERTTGVTTMMTVAKLDAGDILMQEATEIGMDETAGELYKRLAAMGATLLRRTLDAIETGACPRIPQDEASATKCDVIRKETAQIDFNKSDSEIHNLVRGMNPAPVAFTSLDGAIMRVYRTVLHSELSDAFNTAEIGECVIADSKRGLFVKCGSGIIEITEVQFAGSKRMDARAALNSRKLIGRVLDR